MQSGEPHEHEKTRGLQCDRLAAGIRAGDDQKIKSLAQPDIGRNDFLLIDQRMPGFTEVDDPFAVDERLACVHGDRERCPCENEIQTPHQCVIISDQTDVSGQHFRQIGQNDFDLLLFLDLELTDLVVQPDDGGRLDEERGSRGTHIVHDAGHGILVLTLHGNTVAPVPGRHQGILEIILRVR